MDRRLYHLDFLRAFMLFLGVFYRSAHADAGTGEYDFVRDISGAFRMACFFIISGYFSALVLERRGDFSFLKGRVLMLGVPALVCVIFLAPITHDWMDVYHSESGTGKPFIISWMQHAWFLFALLLYTLPLTIMVRYSKSIVECLGGYMTLNSARLVLFGAVVGFCVFLQEFLLPNYVWGVPGAEYFALFSIITAQHFPYFLLGVYMFLWRDLYAMFNSRSGFWSVAALICIAGAIGMEVAVSQLNQAGYQWHWVEYLVSIYEYALAIVISIALFALSARYLDQDYFVVGLMAKSAYTVYVVHFILVAFLLLFLQRVGLSMDVRMVVSALVACGVGMLFHFIVVEKVRFASFLFNGRLQPSRVNLLAKDVENTAR